MRSEDTVRNSSEKVEVIIGAARAGKTRRILELYADRLKKSGASSAVLLVPSHRQVRELKRLLLTEYSLPSLVGARILTLPDVSDAILRENHQSLRPISPMARHLLLRHIVRGLHEGRKLVHFAPLSGYPGFLRAVLELLSELKRGAVEPEQLEQVSQEGEFREKRTQELSAIYTAYQNSLNELNLFDAEGRFWWARNLMEHGQCKPFEQIGLLLVDGFSDWTPTQWNVLRHLVDRCDEAVFTLTLENPENSQRADLFLPTGRTLERLRATFGGAVQTDYIHPDWLQDQHLERLAHYLFVPMVFDVLTSAPEPGQIPGREDSEESLPIEIITAPGKSREVEAIARRVKELLLNGVPPDSIGVVFRHLEEYGGIASETFRALGVPIHVERGPTLLEQPVVAALFGLLRVPARDYRRTDVLQFFNSSYADVSEITPEGLTLSGLDWATREAAITRGADRWVHGLRELIRNPRSTRGQRGANGENLPTKSEALQNAARLSLEFFTNLRTLFDAIPTTARLSDYLDSLSGLSHFLTVAETEDLSRSSVAMAYSLRAREEAGAWQMLWDSVSELRQLTARCSEMNSAVDMRGFSDLLRELLADVRLPASARAEGRVKVMDVFQSRDSSFNHLFIGGLQEKEFPRIVRESPFFSDAERQRLNALGVNLTERLPRQREEAFLFYQAVTRARHRLYLSHPSSDSSGREVIPSYYLQMVDQCFRGVTIHHREEKSSQVVRSLTDVCSQREMEENVFFELSRPRDRLRDGAAALRDAYNLLAGGQSDRVKRIYRGVEAQTRRYARGAFDEFDGMLRDNRAVRESLQQAFPRDSLFSAGQLGLYGSCPFRYFAERLIRAEPMDEPTELVEPRQRGIVYHRILQRFLQRHAGPVTAESLPAAREMLTRLVDDCFASAAEDIRTPGKALWNIEKNLCHEVMERFLQHEVTLTEKGHVPLNEYLEVAYGGAAAVPPLAVTHDGETVWIAGRIDRIDKVGGEGFAVYDYKTGTAPGAQCVVEGTDLQLPIYAMAASSLLFDGCEDCVGWAYYSVKTPVRLASAVPSKKHAVSELLDVARTHIVNDVRQIRQGCFQVHPKGDVCNRCGLKPLCRVESWRIRDKTEPRLTHRRKESGNDG